MSNLLAMPLVGLTVETGNNEDWIDSIKFVVDTGDVDPPQLDLREIEFEMEIRRAANDPEVIVAASTENGTLIVGDPPNFGFLTISIPLADMQNIVARDYVGDIIGIDDVNTRRIASIDLTIVEGVTKQPVNKRIVVVAA
jgi:hypothetical protein